jgi:hypothetical protein
MKIGIEYSTGNFTLSIVGNVDTQGMEPKEPLATTIMNGIRYDVERGVASTCYKEIDGKSGKLPKGYKRDSMTFSVEKAARFTEIAVRELKGLMPDVEVVTTENVGTLKADAIAVLTDLESKPEGVMEAALEKLGYYGETHGENGEFHPAAVSAIALEIKRRQAALKATMMSFA